MIASAKAIGIQTVNLGSSELSNGDKHPHLVLGLVWQLGNFSHKLFDKQPLNIDTSQITAAQHNQLKKSPRACSVT